MCWYITSPENSISLMPRMSDDANDFRQFEVHFSKKLRHLNIFFYTIGYFAFKKSLFFILHGGMISYFSSALKQLVKFYKLTGIIINFEIMSFINMSFINSFIVLQRNMLLSKQIINWYLPNKQCIIFCLFYYTANILSMSLSYNYLT